MEEKNPLESNETNQNNDVTTENAEQSSQEGSTHHGSHSHHRSHSHHSMHSHHGKHRSSRHKMSSKTRRKIFMAKIQKWIEKKAGSKTIAVICLAMLLIISLLVGMIHMLQTQISNLPGNYPGDSTPYEPQSPSGNPEGTNRVPNNTASTSMAIPSYWEDMIEEKTKTVKKLQTAGGKDCVSFVWASDTHIPDNKTSRTDDIGKLMAQMMNNCNIPFAVVTGDIGTRVSYDTEDRFLQTQQMIPVHLAPLWGTDRLLINLGNHDGCYGDTSCSFKKQLSPERMWEFYFRNQALDSRRVFSEDGTYYYVDNTAQKIRFIILNSQFGGSYLQDGNGIAVNDRFEISCYGQEQLDWLADVALDMPEGYGAIITSHVPLNVTYTVDKDQLIGIINAYCNKTQFSGSYTAGVDGWTNSTVSVDFSDAKGEIIAMFTGHVHQDTIDSQTLACPLITIISAGAQVNFGENPERTFGTDTETSFDVVTINRKTRTIYCTRVGWGYDRAIRY